MPALAINRLQALIAASIVSLPVSLLRSVSLCLSVFLSLIPTPPHSHTQNTPETHIFTPSPASQPSRWAPHCSQSALPRRPTIASRPDQHPHRQLSGLDSSPLLNQRPIRLLSQWGAGPEAIMNWTC